MADFEEFEGGGLDELEEMVGDEEDEYQEEAEVDDDDIGPSDDVTGLSSEYEALPKVGPLSGRLVELVILILAVIMFLNFYINRLWEDTDKIYSLEMGLELIIGISGLAGIILLYVAASTSIAKGDFLCRKNMKEAYKAAMESYSKALKIVRSKKAWTGKGLAIRMLSHEKSNLMEAVKCHNMAIKLDPKFGPAWVNKGNVLFNLGNSNEAIKCYDKAIELDPDYTVAWVNKGEMLVKMGRRKEAQKCLDKARSLAG